MNEWEEKAEEKAARRRNMEILDDIAQGIKALVRLQAMAAVHSATALVQGAGGGVSPWLEEYRDALDPFLQWERPSERGPERDRPSEGAADGQ